MSFLPFGVAAWLFLIGLYGIVTSRNLIHLIICLSVVQSSTYVLLLAVGYVDRGTAPIFLDTPGRRPRVDPVVQALTLTDVVVSVTLTALLLALALAAFRRRGTLDPGKLAELHG